MFTSYTHVTRRAFGAEHTLELTEERRCSTLVRVDAGAGSVANITWVLARGYHIIAKDYSTARARLLAAQVTDWITDPRQPERQAGLITDPATMDHSGRYRRSVTRGAVRCRQANGQWGGGVMVTTLPAADALTLTGQDPVLAADPAASLLTYGYLYDQRGGAAETTFKEDKQGLGITKRAKKLFEAQQMVVGLGGLAHNVLVWARRWLAVQVPQVGRFGIKRVIRDVFGIRGLVALDGQGKVRAIVLSQADRLAHRLLTALRALLDVAHVTLTLGET